MAKKSKFSGVQNTEYMRAMQELRRSGKYGTHNNKKDRRARTRQASKFKAIADQMY